MVSAGGSSGLQLNLATQGRWQTGSSFEPFVLVTALEQGHQPRDDLRFRPHDTSLPSDVATILSTDEGR